MAELATSACPFVYAIQCHWLALLSIVDDGILAIEDKAETVFPPSTHVFNKVDQLLHIAETLPGRFDGAAGKLPLIFHRVPLLEWLLAYVVSWLNFFLSVLVDVGSDDDDAAREKEIIVDKNCNEQTESSGKSEDTMESPAEGLKCSYKEALEKGTKDENEIIRMEIVKEVGVSKENEENGEKTIDSMVIEEDDEKNVREDEESISKDDPILELFESGWHKKTGVGALCPSQSLSNLEE